jgi:C4-dicarboxylate-specific signal transduction histidine kinase
MSGDLEQVVSEIEQLTERLGDLAMEELRRAISSGAQKRPQAERQITKARNALERALVALRRIDEGGDPDSDED